MNDFNRFERFLTILTFITLVDFVRLWSTWIYLKTSRLWSNSVDFCRFLSWSTIHFVHFEPFSDHRFLSTFDFLMLSLVNCPMVKYLRAKFAPFERWIRKLYFEGIRTHFLSMICLPYFWPCKIRKILTDYCENGIARGRLEEWSFARDFTAILSRGVQIHWS